VSEKGSRWLGLGGWLAGRLGGWPAHQPWLAEL